MRYFYRSESGREYPIIKMFDIDGDENDDPTMAVTVIVQENPMSRWLVQVDEKDIIERPYGKQ